MVLILFFFFLVYELCVFSLFFLLVAPSGMVDLGPLGESTNENFSLNGGEILLFHSCFLRMIDKKNFIIFSLSLSLFLG